MINIKRILCPTDLSLESDEALRYAIALACAYEAKLFPLYCKQANAEGNEEAGLQVDQTGSLFIDSLAAHLGLTSLCDLNWEGLVAENVSDVGKAIVQKARENKIDLIVMRSRRRPRAAAVLGSTAETVSRTAPCPLLVTHPHEREWVGLSTGQIDLHRVLVAYDFSADSKLALNYGISLAQEYQAELHLLHVLSQTEPSAPELAWAPGAMETAYTQAAQQLQRAIPQEVFLWCKVTSAVRHGKPHQQVLDYAKEQQIDLICMGASGSGFALGTLLGSTVDRVLRQAPCPTLVARPIA
ncbi:MAG TPA: universal stress protein [Pyrinomonadaceae bacterium]|nr:universal stress protein [Pyrinomonadaceae bacterium]